MFHIRYPMYTCGFPSQCIKSTKVLTATPQGRHLGYHTPEQVSNQEPPDSRSCVLTTTLLGGVINTISCVDTMISYVQYMIFQSDESQYNIQYDMKFPHVRYLIHQYTISYYDIVVSKQRYRSADSWYCMYVKSYTIFCIRYHMSKVWYFRSKIGYHMHTIL